MSGYKWTPKPKPAAPRPYTQIRCGTTSGYNFHYTHHENPCTACRKAFSKYTKTRRPRIRFRRKRRTPTNTHPGTLRLLEATAEAYEKPRTNR